VPPGGRAFVRIRLEAPAVLTRGDRFILRAYSPPVTIGGGTVLDPHPPRGAIRTASGRARFRRLDTTSPDEAIAAFVDERGPLGLPVPALVSRAGLSAAGAAAAVQRLTGDARAVEIGGLLVAPPVLDDLSRGLLAAIEAHHKSEPLSEGLPREEGRERVFGRAAPPVFDSVVARLAAEGTIVARERLSLAGRQVSLSPEEACAQEALERVFRAAGLAPPDLTSAATAAGIAPGVADRVSKLLLRQKTLVKIDMLLFHAEALAGLKAEVRGLKSAGDARVDVAAFKLRYGITRKYAIPLLEYLDRERVTRRVGDSRVVL
jgi:selenocysteine-specific elongation factor